MSSNRGQQEWRRDSTERAHSKGRMEEGRDGDDSSHRGATLRPRDDGDDGGADVAPAPLLPGGASVASALLDGSHTLHGSRCGACRAPLLVSFPFFLPVGRLSARRFHARGRAVRGCGRKRGGEWGDIGTRPPEKNGAGVFSTSEASRRFFWRFDLPKKSG